MRRSRRRRATDSSGTEASVLVDASTSNEQPTGDSQTSSSCSSSRPTRRRKRQEQDTHSVEEGQTPDTSYSSSSRGWHGLPDVVLGQVLALLSDEDVVSVGQTCGAWRRAALYQDVWRHRVLDYWPTDPRHPNYGGQWHRNARRFARVVRFAPCVATLRCNRGMKPGARKAVFTDSKCAPRALEINGGLAAAVKYIKKWRDHIETLGVLNPSLECLRTAVEMPRLSRFFIRFKFDHYKHEYQVPSLTTDGLRTSSSIKTLEFYNKVAPDAVDSLLRALASSVETLSLTTSVLPDALSECGSLQNLSLEITDPTEQGPHLKTLLQGRPSSGPLKELKFVSFGVHDQDACSSLRSSLRDVGVVPANYSIDCDSCRRGYAIHPDLHRGEDW